MIEILLQLWSIFMKRFYSRNKHIHIILASFTHYDFIWTLDRNMLLYGPHYLIITEVYWHKSGHWTIILKPLTSIIYIELFTLRGHLDKNKRPTCFVSFVMAVTFERFSLDSIRKLMHKRGHVHNLYSRHLCTDHVQLRK